MLQSLDTNTHRHTHTDAWTRMQVKAQSYICIHTHKFVQNREGEWRVTRKRLQACAHM